MRAVIDTNVFVSSFFGGNPRKIIDLWRTGTISICLSKEILDEYIEVFARIGLAKSDIEELVSLFGTGYNSVFTNKTPEITAVEKDTDDDKFIECAVALKAEVIITGDKHLQEIREYLGTRMEPPGEFLKRFED